MISTAVRSRSRPFVARRTRILKFRDRGREKDLSPCLVFSPFFHRGEGKFRKTARQTTIKISSPRQDRSRYAQSFFQDMERERRTRTRSRSL